VSSALHAAGRLLLRWETLLVVAIFGVGVWSTTLSPFFLKRANLLDLLTPYVFIGLMAFGLTFIVIAGEIDISLVANMAVSVVCFAQIFAAGANVWVAGLAGLAVATALGLVNGLLVGLLNLPSLAITLGTLAAYGGLAFVVFTSQEIASFPSDYTELGGGYISNELPVALFVLLGSALVLGLLLHASRFGRYVFAIGSNREAARFSGIPVARVRVTVFALCGLMAGVAGVVYVGYFGSARADAGTGSLLDVVTAVVLGGVDIFGGSGSMLGVLLALVLVAELRNGMQLANVAGYTQDIVIGVMLLTAIAAGNLLRAAQTGGVRPGRLFPRRREVIRHDAAETVVPPRFDPQNSKGR
jgi:rhamnose transport system permease protein